MKRKRDNLPVEPFLPFVTLGQFLAYDENKPETYTPSPLVNAVARTFQRFGMVRCAEVARHLHLDQRKLSTALEITIGFNLTELRIKHIERLIAQCRAEHPEWSNDELARHMGFFNRSALWHLTHRDNLGDALVKFSPGRVKNTNAHKRYNLKFDKPE